MRGTLLKKLIASAALALMVAGSAGVAQAGHDGANGHEPQDHGLCTAYFNGNKNGWEKNGTPPPFQGLEARAEAAEEDVETFCGDLTGGNPGPNGKSDGKGQGGN